MTIIEKVLLLSCLMVIIFFTSKIFLPQENELLVIDINEKIILKNKMPNQENKTQSQNQVKALLQSYQEDPIKLFPEKEKEKEHFEYKNKNLKYWTKRVVLETQNEQINFKHFENPSFELVYSHPVFKKAYYEYKESSFNDELINKMEQLNNDDNELTSTKLEIVEHEPSFN